MARLTNFCNSFMLTQVVGEPTHVSTSGNQSLIDHVFLSHPQQLKQCCVAPPLGTSDHNCINLRVTHRCGTTKHNKKSNRTIWRYQQADFDRANNLLNEVNWDELLEGDVDQMWYKGSNHTSVSNYRPISLLPILSKLLEKHVHGLILNHLNLRHPIALQQWGFQSKKFSVSALIDVSYNWSKALDQGNEVCAVFFDLQKAFDSVPHRSLIEKLKFIELDPFLVRWVYSYLIDRKQYVVLNGERSATCNVISSVPQGSVLGPLLFLIYINDSVCSTVLDGNCISLYADDMSYRIIDNSQDFDCVQQGIDNIGRWVAENDLHLNSAKCKFMVVTRRRTKGNPIPELLLYGQPLERVSEYKYLGVILSANLSWTPHIEKVVTKIRRMIGMLYRQFYQWSDPEALIRLYISLIRPHLEYAAPVWSPEHMKDINKLENVQKFALRVCTKQWNSPYEDLIDMCHLPELRTRRNHLSLGLLHKIINEECILPNAPLTPYSSTYFTRSHAGSTFALPYACTNVLHNLFFHRTISLWNALPPDVSTITSIPSFKHQLLYFC